MASVFQAGLTGALSQTALYQGTSLNVPQTANPAWALAPAGGGLQGLKPWSLLPLFGTTKDRALIRTKSIH